MSRSKAITCLYGQLLPLMAFHCLLEKHSSTRRAASVCWASSAWCLLGPPGTDLSFPTWDRTCALCIGALGTLDCQEVPAGHSHSLSGGGGQHPTSPREAPDFHLRKPPAAGWCLGLRMGQGTVRPSEIRDVTRSYRKFGSFKL